MRFFLMKEKRGKVWENSLIPLLFSTEGLIWMESRVVLSKVEVMLSSYTSVVVCITLNPKQQRRGNDIV